MFNVVVALDNRRGIGREGRLPWKLAGDMRYFRELTTCPDRGAVERRYGLEAGAGSGGAETLAGLWARLKAADPLPLPSPDHRNAVLMGRKTWEGLPPAFKPLPNRLNGVLSRLGAPDDSGTHRVFGAMDQALAWLERDDSVREIFIIGGGRVYAEALQSPRCARIYLTAIESEFPCDVFFPEIPADFRATAVSPTWEESGLHYRFHRFDRDPIG